MKLKIAIIALVVLLLSSGCTRPTQVLAEESQRRGVQAVNENFNDLSLLAKQYVVNTAVAKARSAAFAGNADDAQLAVQFLANEWDKLYSLAIKHERANVYLRNAKRYIWEQQGVLNILWDELQRARQVIKERDEAESQSQARVSFSNDVSKYAAPVMPITWEPISVNVETGEITGGIQP